MDLRDAALQLVRAGWISRAEAARHLGVSRSTVTRWTAGEAIDEARDKRISRLIDRVSRQQRKRLTKAQQRNGIEARTADYLRKGGVIHKRT